MHCVAPTNACISRNSTYCIPPKLALPATLCYAFRTVTVTHVDEVRADGRHRNGVLRITIACTGVAAARFPLCLHVKSRHLGDAYRYPTRHSDLCPTGTPNELRDSNANSIHRTSTVLSRRGIRSLLLALQ
ncbi:hypothetical protein LF1_54950 [Rubripirellula obstinata]|uniref:Uncharacterized protein n=1 Tax=Rubripirellula obstinata TaxID=406547 RepID=A0A5B1CAT8_9BACT|nr:hypothetical protein LF1_54950 [Rubripirellula obstinata]